MPFAVAVASSKLFELFIIQEFRCKYDTAIIQFNDWQPIAVDKNSLLLEHLSRPYSECHEHRLIQLQEPLNFAQHGNVVLLNFSHKYCLSFAKQECSKLRSRLSSLFLIFEIKVKLTFYANDDVIHSRLAIWLNWTVSLDLPRCM